MKIGTECEKGEERSQIEFSLHQMSPVDGTSRPLSRRSLMAKGQSSLTYTKDVTQRYFIL